MTTKTDKQCCDDMDRARQAIIEDLDKRHKAGDKRVKFRARSADVYQDYAPYNFISGNGQIPCPICKTGTLAYARSAYNSHVHARCSTEDCVSWLE